MVTSYSLPGIGFSKQKKTSAVGGGLQEGKGDRVVLRGNLVDIAAQAAALPSQQTLTSPAECNVGVQLVVADQTYSLPVRKAGSMGYLAPLTAGAVVQVEELILSFADLAWVDSTNHVSVYPAKVGKASCFLLIEQRLPIITNFRGGQNQAANARVILADQDRSGCVVGMAWSPHVPEYRHYYGSGPEVRVADGGQVFLVVTQLNGEARLNTFGTCDAVRLREGDYLFITDPTRFKLEVDGHLQAIYMITR